MALYFREEQPPLWQNVAINLIGGLIGDMIKRDREYKQNKRYNEAINNAIAGAGNNGRAYMDSVSAMPEGYNDGGWEQAFHKSYTPMTEYNIGTADLMPKLPQQPPSGWDMRQSMATQLAGTGINPEAIEKLYTPYIQNAEQEYQQWWRNKAAEDFGNAVALSNQTQPQTIQPPLMTLPQEQPVQQTTTEQIENLYKAILYPRYESIFQKVAQQYGVEPELIEAIIKTESGGNPNAVSPVGAQGLMQLMPKTAAGLGVQNAFDPYQNIMGGSKYIANLIKQYNGDIEKALWAYNAGPGNVAKGRKPKETRNYIPNVMNEYSRLKGLRTTQPTTPAQTTPQGQYYTDWSQFNNRQAYPSALLEAQKGVINGTMPESILNSLRDYNTHNNLSAWQLASLYDADKQRAQEMYKFGTLSAAQQEEARLKGLELNQKQQQFDVSQAYKERETQRLQDNWQAEYEARERENNRKYEIDKERNALTKQQIEATIKHVDAQINELNKRDFKAGVEGYTKAIETINEEIYRLEDIIEDRKSSTEDKEQAIKQKAALIEAKNKYTEGLNNFILNTPQGNSTTGIATFPKEQLSQANATYSGTTTPVSADIPLVPTSPDIQPTEPVSGDIPLATSVISQDIQSPDIQPVTQSTDIQPTAQPSNNAQQQPDNSPALFERVVNGKKEVISENQYQEILEYARRNNMDVKDVINYLMKKEGWQPLMPPMEIIKGISKDHNIGRNFKRLLP